MTDNRDTPICFTANEGPSLVLLFAIASLLLERDVLSLADVEHRLTQARIVFAPGALGTAEIGGRCDDMMALLKFLHDRTRQPGAVASSEQRIAALEEAFRGLVGHFAAQDTRVRTLLQRDAARSAMEPMAETDINLTGRSAVTIGHNGEVVLDGPVPAVSSVRN
jgi:hypothetical protein